MTDQHKTASKKGDNPNRYEKRLYSIKEMVSEIGATAWYWRSKIWDGQLPFIQVGRKMFVDSSDIDEFIRKNKYQNQ